MIAVQPTEALPNFGFLPNPGVLHISGGRGNTDEDEVHISLRVGHTDYAGAWYKVSELLDAISAAQNYRQERIEH